MDKTRNDMITSSMALPRPPICPRIAATSVSSAVMRAVLSASAAALAATCASKVRRESCMDDDEAGGE
jgi:hypothetical protein